jgi:REP element-mobilizing transposase RayT
MAHDPQSKAMTGPTQHHRRSIRLKNYDYSQPGAYFVTVVAQDRQLLFGEVDATALRLNAAGQMVERWWAKITQKYPTLASDEFVVMPNHFHGIVVISGGPVVAPVDIGQPHGAAPTIDDDDGPPRGVAPTVNGESRGPTLGDVMDWLKTMTTNAYIQGVERMGWQRFRGRLWQRNYYEHVVRDEEELNRIRQYIACNPLQWAFDPENPGGMPPEQVEPWEV